MSLTRDSTDLEIEDRLFEIFKFSYLLPDAKEEQKHRTCFTVWYLTLREIGKYTDIWRNIDYKYKRYNDYVNIFNLTNNHNSKKRKHNSETQS